MLHARSSRPKASANELCELVKRRSGIELSAEQLDALKLEAKATFAQLLADEVVETLEHPDKALVQREIKSLGIGGAFAGLGV